MAKVHEKNGGAKPKGERRERRTFSERTVRVWPEG